MNNKKRFEKNKEEFRNFNFNQIGEIFSDLDRTFIGSIFWNARIALNSLVFNHAAWADIEMAELETTELQYSRVEADLEMHKVFLKKKEEEVEAAKKAYELAQRDLKAANRFHEELIESKERYSKKIDESKKRLNQMNTIVLMHSSATLKRAEENQFSYIIITKADEEKLKEIMPNDVFDVKMAESFVEKLPVGFEKRHLKSERESILEFCEMTINFMLQADATKKIKLIYAEPDIAEIIRLNGFEI